MMALEKDNVVYSGWSNQIYPCAEGCGFVGRLDAWRFGGCYDPCPECGAERIRRTGRFVYRKEGLRFLPFIKRRVYIGVQWRDADLTKEER